MMKQIRLLIGDGDRAYVEALVRFLIGIGKGFSVTSYTKPQLFLQEEGIFSAALLSADFLAAAKEEAGLYGRLGEVLLLSDGTEDGGALGNVEKLYKFQAMDAFVERLSRISEKAPVVREDENSSQRIISIYSPMHHELTLPYGLTISRILSEHGATLFVDLEQVSILPILIEKNVSRDLLDYLYLLEGGVKEPEKLKDFLGFYEGFYYLPPMSGLSGVSSVHKGQWLELLSVIRRTDFANVILVFDSILPGMERMLSASEDIMLLSKSGDYYEKSMGVFAGYLEKAGLLSKVKKVMLPMSAGNLVDGTYRMSHLLTGNLGGFVRREFASAAGA